MKATEKMIAALKEMGIANEWHMGDYNRLYIDLAKADKLYYDNSDNDALSLCHLCINRRERNNGKVWIDMDNGEIGSKAIDGADYVINQIIELINLFIAPEAAEEEAEESEAAAESTDDTAEEYNAVIDIDYYKAGSGYSHTETFDTQDCDEYMEASDYWDSLDRGCYEAFALDDGDWMVIRVTMYDALDPNAADRPLHVSEHTVDSDDLAARVG